MNLEDIQNNNIDVETLPDEIHMQLTVHKLANELITISTILDKAYQSNNKEEMRKTIIQVRLHIIKLVATMIHLFDWIDFGDIIDKNNLRKYMEEYLFIQDKLERTVSFDMIQNKGNLSKEKGE